ncbi:hypothetical protein BHQ23_08065 [Mycobacterium gordonae]|nr:hypothetical protein BHQ23_08065 [Mycobacterium gordonae]
MIGAERGDMARKRPAPPATPEKITAPIEMPEAQVKRLKAASVTVVAFTRPIRVIATSTFLPAIDPR